MYQVDNREPDKNKKAFSEIFPFTIYDNMLVGDYRVKNHIFERKEIGDFVNSYKGDKIKRQIDDMIQTGLTPWLVIVGDYDKYVAVSRKFSGGFVNYQTFLRMITNIQMTFPQLKIIQISNNNQLMELFVYLDSKEFNEYQVEIKDVFKHSKTNVNEHDVHIAMLSCIPGISRDKAKLILNKIHWNDLFNLDDEFLRKELIEIDGIGKTISERLFKYLRI